MYVHFLLLWFVKPSLFMFMNKKIYPVMIEHPSFRVQARNCRKGMKLQPPRMPPSTTPRPCIWRIYLANISFPIVARPLLPPVFFWRIYKAQASQSASATANASLYPLKGTDIDLSDWNRKINSVLQVYNLFRKCTSNILPVLRMQCLSG